jgi:hypothetical protein
VGWQGRRRRVLARDVLLLLSVVLTASAGLLIGATPAGASASTTVGVQVVASSTTLDAHGQAAVTVINADPSPSTVGLVINVTAPTKVNAAAPDRMAAPCTGPPDADGRSACWKLSFALAGGQSATAVLTVTPARALALTAYSSDGSVATASLGTTTLASWWADWWSGGVLPVVEALAEIALILLAVSLVASQAADLGSGQWWNRLPRPQHLRAAGFSIVVLGLIRLLAFSGWPSTVARAAQDVFDAGATSTVALVTGGATVILLVLAGGGVGLWLRTAKQWVGGSVFPALYRERYLWWIVLAALLGAGITLTLWPRSSPPPSAIHPAASILLGTALVLVGTVLITWQAAFTPQLSLDAQSATLDGQKLGQRLPVALRSIGSPGRGGRLQVSDGQDQTKMAADALKAIPSTGALGAAYSAAFAAAPRAGYRLLIASEANTDGTVVTARASLRRGSSECASVQICSTELSPPGVTSTAAADPAGDVATALAAWVYLELGRSLKTPAWGLAGTTEWRSLALATIGARHDAAGDPSAAAVLFEMALAADPDNLHARFDHLQSRFAGAITDPDGPAAAGVRAYQGDVDAMLEKVQTTYPLTPLHARAAYLAAVATASSYTPEQPGLFPDRAELLVSVCRELQGGVPVGRRRQFAAALKVNRVVAEDFTSLTEVPSRDLPRGADHQPGAEFAASVLAPAAVLWSLPVAAAGNLGALAPLQALHGPQACYDLACLYAAAATATQDTTRKGDAFATAQSHLETAMIDPALSGWAVHDPSLAPLWAHDRCASYAGYASRLEELGRKPRGASADFVQAGISLATAGYLGDIAHVADFPTLAAFRDDDAHRADRARAPQSVLDELNRFRARCDLAANPAVGPAVAKVLGDLGLDERAKVIRRSVEEVRDSVLAWVHAHPDANVPEPTLEVVRGWLLAVATASGSHPWAVDLRRSDGEVVIVEVT